MVSKGVVRALCVPVLTAMLMGGSLVLASSAGAWSPPTAVSRPCGTNDVYSAHGGGSAAASTWKLSGSCAGNLGAAVRYAWGHANPTWAYPAASTPWVSDAGAVGGSHFGCQSGCGETRT